MTGHDTKSAVTADAVFDAWLGRFGAAVEQRQADKLVQLFEPGGYWRDILSFTWEHRTFSGWDEIRDAFNATAADADAKRIRLATSRSGTRLVRRAGQDVVEGYFDFDTKVGTGAGFVRLRFNDADPLNSKILLLLTSLYDIRGYEEKTDSKRPSGEEFSQIESPESWKQRREKEKTFSDRDPEVLVVGAGQGGLLLAARLRQMGVDALVIEKTEHVGDVWRDRYNNLTLHNEITTNHFPYLQFPSTWPVYLPKDMLGGWLESYAEFMELNVWTKTELIRAEFDDKKKDWRIVLKRGDGTERSIRTKHLVSAIGVWGGVPKLPKLPGMADFKGTVVHSKHFKSGLDWVGKNTIVVGTGNSGHDVAQDLYVSGAASVSIMQRGPSCVVSLDPSAKLSYSIYSEGRPVEDVDLMIAAIPYPVLNDTYKWVTKRTTELDRELLDNLNAVGFKTYLGEEDSGFQMMYLRQGGGYYIDVGCCDLIIQRKIGVLQAEQMDRFVPEGLRMKDGRIVPADLVVMATGFENMQEGIRQILGDSVADRVGPIWGFDEDHVMRNLWRRTAQEGFWVMGGAINEARLFSRFLALEIKASLENILPPRKSRNHDAKEAKRDRQSQSDKLESMSHSK